MRGQGCPVGLECICYPESDAEQAGAADGPVLAQAVRSRGARDVPREARVTALATARARPVPVLVPQLTGDVLLQEGRRDFV
jgi:hypothetical protein